MSDENKEAESASEAGATRVPSAPAKRAVEGEFERLDRQADFKLADEQRIPPGRLRETNKLDSGGESTKES